MKNLPLLRSSLIAALAFSAVGAAMAADGGRIDPQAPVPGHPASPRWIATPHANQEHPAVVQARGARDARIDPNTFILGHPASPRWIDVAAPQEPVVAASTTVIQTAKAGS